MAAFATARASERTGRRSRTCALLCALLPAIVCALLPCRAAEPTVERPRLAPLPVPSLDLSTRFEIPAPVGATRSEPTAAAPAPADVRSRGAFVLDHLVPRLRRQLGDVAILSPEGVLGLAPSGGNARDDLAELAWKRADRASLRALQDWAVDATGLEARFDRWAQSSSTARALAPDLAGGRARVRFGVAHLLPVVNVTADAGRTGTVRLSLATRGTIGVDWAWGHGTRTRLHGGYDAGRETADASVRFSF